MVSMAITYGKIMNKNKAILFRKNILSFLERLEYNDGKCADGIDFSSDDEWRDLFLTLML